MLVAQITDTHIYAPSARTFGDDADVMAESSCRTSSLVMRMSCFGPRPRTSHIWRPRNTLYMVLACTSLLAAQPGALLAQVVTPLDPARIDAVFAAFTDQTPGCAASAVRDGHTIYARGFGLADLSHRAPIGPDTVFEIASISKQFTALAILLLEADGKLKLDDSVQQHLPELAPLIRQRITLRQLLHHTSGMVGYEELLELAGGAAKEKTLNATDVMRVIALHPKLNSAPGTRYSYSDTGYVLAARIVARVSGGSMNALLQARVFGPLGMTSTHIFSDHRRVVPNRARAYATGASPTSWVLDESNWTMDGDAGVQSTALDLARWGAEVTRPRVLPPGVVEALRTPGRLIDGTPVPYGFGQVPDSYRGLPRAWHGGAWVAWRSALLHFPTVDTSVAVTCNVASARALQTAERVADEVLAGALASAPVSGAAAPGAEAAWRYEGRFMHVDGFELASVSSRAPGVLDAQLGSRRRTLHAAEGGGWRSTVGATHIQLDRAGQMLHVTQPGRATERYRRIGPFTPSQEEVAALHGRYRNGALGSTLFLAPRSDGVDVRLNARDAEMQSLQWAGRNYLANEDYVLRIERNAQGKVVALVYGTERVRGLRYARLP